jgi:hypothetical protein
VTTNQPITFDVYPSYIINNYHLFTETEGNNACCGPEPVVVAQPQNTLFLLSVQSLTIWKGKWPGTPASMLGTGHKVTARVGRSDLGWAIENLWAVSMGRQYFYMSTVGPPNKNPCLLQKIGTGCLLQKYNSK